MKYIKLFENFDSPIKQPDPFTEEGIEEVRKKQIGRRLEEERRKREEQIRREQIERIKREKDKEEKKEKVIEPSENNLQNYFY